MSLRAVLPLLCLLLPTTINAHNLKNGHRVAPVGISERGELMFNQDKFSYKNWNSSQLTGKVRVVQHIAGRASAKEMNASLIEAIKQARLPKDRYQTTTIVNTDDAIPGTGMFVRNSIESNKKQYPWSQFVVDDQGRVQHAWKLDSGGSAIVVLDSDGRVRFVKDGALTAQEVQQVITLLHQLVKK